jgi:hypothetical protein
MNDTTSTYPPEIAKAIIAVKKQVKQLGTDDRNPHGGYSYVSVDKFYDSIGKPMAEAGLALLIDETGSDVKEGSSGKPWLFAQYSLSFLHESGVVSDPLRRSLALPISGPQAYGAAQSYVEKQFLRQVFKIPIGEKDADSIAPEDTPPKTDKTAASKAGPSPEPNKSRSLNNKPHPIPVINADWIKWGGQFVAALNEAQTRDEVERWIVTNEAQLNGCEAEHPKAYMRVKDNIATARRRLPDFMQPDDDER